MIPPLEGAVIISAAPDCLILKKGRCITVALFKEDSQHVHIQRFSKAARASEQRYLWERINEVSDQQCLVHIVIVCDRFHIARDADRQREQRRRFVLSKDDFSSEKNSSKAR